MPARTPLSDEQIDAAISDDWGRQADDGDAWIERTFEFDDFRTAFAFLTRVAFEAEAMNHHPEITSVYNRVALALSTHDADNQVTGMDIELARRIDDIL